MMLVGSLVVLAASASWAIGSYWSSRLPLPRDPFVATVWEMAGGGVVLLVAGLSRGEASGLDLGAVSTRSWLALGYLVVFGSLVAFTAYVWLLQNAPISLVATYAYVNPVIAVILGAALLAEPVTAAIIVGGAIVVAGVAVVVSTERPRSSAPRECEPAA
jgi:drug/metabolite transporter (DMT)-like permease